MTFGPTEQEGTVVTADGQYFITSMGTQLATVWLRDSAGERQLTSETYALLLMFVPSGDCVYYLARNAGARAYAGRVALVGEPRHRAAGARVARGARREITRSLLMAGRRSPRRPRMKRTAGFGSRSSVAARHCGLLTKSGQVSRVFFGAPGKIVYLTQKT